MAAAGLQSTLAIPELVSNVGKWVIGQGLFIPSSFRTLGSPRLLIQRMSQSPRTVSLIDRLEYFCSTKLSTGVHIVVIIIMKPP
jgi:hypothetical protein